MSTHNHEESKSLSENLEEILKLQEELKTRVCEHNERLEAKFESIKDFVSRANDYIPILKQISKDMVEVCERTRTLKTNSAQLEKRVQQEAENRRYDEKLREISKICENG